MLDIDWAVFDFYIMFFWQMETTNDMYFIAVAWAIHCKVGVFYAKYLRFDRVISASRAIWA